MQSGVIWYKTEDRPGEGVCVWMITQWCMSVHNSLNTQSCMRDRIYIDSSVWTNTSRTVKSCTGPSPEGNAAGDIDKCTPDKSYTISQSQVNKAQQTKPLIYGCVNNNPYSQLGPGGRTLDRKCKGAPDHFKCLSAHTRRKSCWF